MNEILDNILMHVGVSIDDGAPGPGSGRYPKGSGKNPYQHDGKYIKYNNAEFLNEVRKQRANNFTFTDKDGNVYTGDHAIYKAMGMTSTEFRTRYSLASNEWKNNIERQALEIMSDGTSQRKAADQLGIGESTLRSILNETSSNRRLKAEATADILREAVEKKGMIDVGAGTENELGVSRERLNQALYILKEEGYPTFGGGIPQPTNKGQQTNQKVLCPKGSQAKDIYNYEKVNTLKDYDVISYDGGESFRKAFYYPESLDSKRLMIRYAEDGGTNKDGLIELRPGVKDISLGDAVYSQVRIMVDGTHYLKGMAVYSDDLPDGIDVRFNTNKSNKVSKMDTLKKIKDDPDNPFGSLIKEHGGQSFYDDPKGKYEDPITGKKQSLSLINKRADEGDWNDWSDKLSAQFLSKQTVALAKQQLKIAEMDKQAEYDEICSLTNPTLKKKLLKDFSDSCDSAAVHLYAAALPRQKYQVIIPLETLKDNEIYAPNYQNGEMVALIRYPHGSISEIPILKVNNKNKEGIRYLTNNPKDAVGINHENAERLSGADFDGDTVMVIPLSSTGKAKIINAPRLAELKDFDTHQYGYDEERVDSEGNTQYYRNGKKYKLCTTDKHKNLMMGMASNLITDMTLKGADDHEIARALKHSMVVIDCEKHKLDYTQSYIDNGIAELKKKYQGHIGKDGKYTESASTLISRSKNEVDVLKTKGNPKIDPDTGKLIYKRVEEKYIDKDGKEKLRTQKSTQMAEADDARTLISDYDTPMENLYADFANKMKSLGNQARKEYLSTGDLKRDPQAAKVYSNEVDSLESKLNISLANRPKERQAERYANAKIIEKKEKYPDLTKKELKKISQQEMTKARQKFGAHRVTIEITPREWEAIQARAVSPAKLTGILKYADPDQVKEYAMPRKSTELSPAKINLLKFRAANGYTNEEIAKSLGCSVSTVQKYLRNS